MPAKAVTTLAEAANHQLQDHADIAALAPTSGQVLQWNGSTWVAATISGVSNAFNDLTDVVITGAAAGDVVRYDGTNWINTKTLTHSYTFNVGSSATAISVTAAASNSARIQLRGNGVADLAGLLIQSDVTADAYFWNYANRPIYVGTNNSERWRWEAAGGVATSFTIITTAQDGFQINRNAGESARIYLRGNAATPGTTSGFLVESSTDGSGYLWNYENKPLHFGTNNAGRMTIANGGTITVTSGVFVVGDSGTSTPSLYITDGTAQLRGYISSNLFRLGTDTNHAWRLMSNNADRVEVDNAGEIRILGNGTSGSQMRIGSTSHTSPYLTFLHSGAVQGAVGIFNTTPQFEIGTSTAHQMGLFTNGLTRVIVQANGDLYCAHNLDVVGTVRTTASGSSAAGFRLPHGAAPSSPVNGDFWTTTSGIFARINGATVGPLAAGLTGSGTTGTIAKWTSSSALGDSLITEASSAILVTSAIGTAQFAVRYSSSYRFEVSVANTTGRVTLEPAGSGSAPDVWIKGNGLAIGTFGLTSFTAGTLLGLAKSNVAAVVEMYATRSNTSAMTTGMSMHAESVVSSGTVPGVRSIHAIAEAYDAGGTVTVTEVAAFVAEVGARNSGVTITAAYGLRVLTPQTTGTIGTYYGIKVEDAPSSSQYAIRTGTGLVWIGDNMVLFGELRDPAGGSGTRALKTEGNGIVAIGKDSDEARMRLIGFYTSSPSDPPQNETDIILVDNGVSPVLRVRYNDAGTMKVGDLALV